MKQFLSIHRHIFSMNLNKFYALIFFLSYAITGISQDDDLGDIFYEDFIYYDHIKSVSLTHTGNVMSVPIMDMNRGTLNLTFDDCEGGDKLYTYKIIHCDRNWNRSQLDEFDYIDGYNGEEIDQFSYSRGTNHDYTNYSLTIPNDDIRWRISGNYLLIIYEGETDTGVPVITRRFMVSESIAGVGVRVINPLTVSLLNTHQKLDVSLATGDLRLKDPLNEIEAFVLQNFRWDNMLSNIKPAFQMAGNLKWDQMDRIVMPASKEFRSFDIRTIISTGDFVHSIDLENDETNVVLDLSVPRGDLELNTDFDFNGKFILDNRDKPDANVTSEYANVIFTLEVPFPYDHEVYVIGKFSDWKAMPQYKMKYDPKRRIYYLDASFKQGYYNYMFALNKDGQLDCETIEGNWRETENDYTVLVYLSEYGSLFDRLIGVGSVNSNN